MQLTTDKMIARTDGHIGWMIFNQPERHNALSLEMQEAIPEILGAFATDDDVHVVVMRGAGDKAFISGADIAEFETRRAAPEAIREFNAIGARAAASYRSLGKPILAMIRGFALGGGLLTALRADIRIAADDSQFGIPAARLGVGYGFESVKPVVDLVGPAHAREILLTGRRFSAAEALRIGLVNRVVAPDALESTVREIAQTIADNAPLTLRLVRTAIDEALKAEAERDHALLDRLVADCFASADYVEGRRAFLEKRRPKFTGR